MVESTICIVLLLHCLQAVLPVDSLAFLGSLELALVLFGLTLVVTLWKICWTAKKFRGVHLNTSHTWQIAFGRSSCSEWRINYVHGIIMRLDAEALGLEESGAIRGHQGFPRPWNTSVVFSARHPLPERIPIVWAIWDRKVQFEFINCWGLRPGYLYSQCLQCGR